MGPKRQRKRRTQQQGAETLGSVFNLGKNLLTLNALRNGLDIGSRTITSEIGKKVIDGGIKHAPELYNHGTNKIKNKNQKKALESGIPNYAVKKHKKNYLMSKGITDFRIETALKNINDEDLNYNFIGVFLASKLNSLYRKKGQISFHNSEHRQLWQGWHALVEYIRH